MITEDYLMKLIMDFFRGIVRSIRRSQDDRDKRGAAEMLDIAIGKATDMDGDALLSLAPESIATILQATGTDEHVIEYMCRSLLLAGKYYGDVDDEPHAKLRVAQGKALAAAYGIDVGEGEFGDAEMEAFLDAQGLD